MRADESDYRSSLSWAYENLGLTQLADRQTTAAVSSCGTALKISRRPCAKIQRKN